MSQPIRNRLNELNREVLLMRTELVELQAAIAALPSEYGRVLADFHRIVNGYRELRISIDKALDEA